MGQMGLMGRERTAILKAFLSVQFVPDILLVFLIQFLKGIPHD
jgi:hypothetical protein